MQCLTIGNRNRIVQIVCLGQQKEHMIFRNINETNRTKVDKVHSSRYTSNKANFLISQPLRRFLMIVENFSDEFHV